MNWGRAVVVDFETYPIRQRPDYPPRPVGVAIKWLTEPSRYYAFGHPTANNSTEGEAREALERVWNSGLPVCAFNMKFDFTVAEEQVGLPWLPVHRTHDPMFLAFLCDPHSRSLGLKELAADLLRWPPEERDAVADWVLLHKDVLLRTYPWNRKINKKTGQPVDNIAPSDVGAWIFACPGDIVDPYACGDCDRTRGLLTHLGPLVERDGMLPAYQRELRLCPILAENERVGMRVDLPNLANDVEGYGWHLETVEGWLRSELQASGLNFDADVDVANVLLQRGVVPAENWTRTKGTKTHPNGQLSVAKDALLPEHFTDPRIASALGYRNRLKTCLTMFMEPWLAQASVNKSYITTNWNQTRGGDHGAGTRTGRPSTDKHNFLNLSKSWDDKNDGYTHPGHLNVARLPLVRRYVLPDDGHVFLHRDFEGQEMRVFAHYECGGLQNQYLTDPGLDPHSWVKQIILDTTGVDLIRTKVKNTNFARLYGGGIGAVQRRAQCKTRKEAEDIANFCDKALPGRKSVVDAIKAVVNRGEPIVTWGGRQYYPEEPKVIDGRRRDFVYKLINYLIQGSAADITKEALITWHEGGTCGARFLVTVYDEINISAANDSSSQAMVALREAMELPRLDVPMLSSGKCGPSWGELEKCA